MFPFCENIIITQALLNGQTPKSIVKMSLGEREPWSSGYGSRLMFERSKCSNPGAIYWMDLKFFHIDLL